MAERVRTVPRLQYLHAYSFVFEGGHGFVTLLLMSLCLMIPIIGPIVGAGYQYEIIANLHRFPKRTYPAFDFGRFGEYLGRGIWKFLADMMIQMIVGPIFTVVIYMGMFAVLLLAMLFANADESNMGMAFGISASIVVPLVILFILAVTIALRLVLNPLILKASLSGDGGDLFDFSFMTDFVKRTWRETIWEVLWVYVTFPVVLILGLLCCIVGVLPALAWTMMADAHTNWQLYEIYLARGGRPVRLKHEPPGPAVMAEVLD